MSKLNTNIGFLRFTINKLAKAAGITLPFKFAEAKLTDGTVVKYDGELMEGTALFVVAADGSESPAPDGTHELEDGTKVTTVGGLVTAIEVAAGVDPKAPEFTEQSYKEVMAKFASGTPEEKAANMEFALKMLLDYAFGWQIREQEQKASIAKITELYNTGFSAQSVELMAGQTAIIEKLSGKVAEYEAKVLKFEEAKAEIVKMLDKIPANFKSQQNNQNSGVPGKFAFDFEAHIEGVKNLLKKN